MISRKAGAGLVGSIAITLAFGCASSTPPAAPYTPWYPQQTYPAPYGQGYQPQPYGPQAYNPQPYQPRPYQPRPYQPAAQYPQPGYPQPGYPQPAYPQPGYPQPGYPQPGYWPSPAPPPVTPAPPTSGPQAPSPPLFGHWLPVRILPTIAPPSSPPSPVEPSPTTPTVPSPTEPSRAGACLISESAQTWKGSAKCSRGTGQCQRSESGELVIQRTGPKSAMISTSGYTDGGASFDPKTCTVSHAHWAPKAPIPISISYSIVVSPEGKLSGNLDAQVKHSIFGCTGNYNLSGTKK